MTERVIVADPENDEIHWLKMAELFDGAEDPNLDSFMEGIKAGGSELNILAKVANVIYGRGQIMENEHEQIIKLPDGRVVFTESEEGIHLITAKPVEDIARLLDRIEAILTD